jgi:hypothetical protein
MNFSNIYIHEGRLFVFFVQWLMKHTSMGCLQCATVLPLPLVLALQLELLLLLIMMTHYHFIHHVIMESNIT